MTAPSGWSIANRRYRRAWRDYSFHRFDMPLRELAHVTRITFGDDTSHSIAGPV